jgi:hypothetical protein
VGNFLFTPPLGLDLNCSSVSSKSPYISSKYRSAFQFMIIFYATRISKDGELTRVKTCFAVFS